jgi:hypothetical protein
MAINKVGSKGIEDGSVATVDLAPGTVTNAKLTNSSFTFDGTSVSLGASESVNVSASWQSVITADGSTGTTAVAGNGYFIDTTSAAHTLTLPASATIGDFIAIKDYAGTFNTNNLTIARNGHNIQGAANDSLITTNRASLVLVYVDSTKGWLYWEEHNVNFLGPLYITATGGTITESGDFKIHTFTGDGCFVVSSVGNASGSTTVNYLVVAGGGGGGGDGGGGGGAGGYRTNYPTCCGLSVTATTYPITVGGGGAGVPKSSSCKGAPGSNSVFSTITSAGGGGGGSNGSGPGANGGSGGGGRASGTGGSGNTPPVSPPQGNDGGNVPNPGVGGAGAGGAGGAGTPNPLSFPADGSGTAAGAGLTNSITGSPTAYSGGGGGGGNGGPALGGSGGTGGGGDGARGGPTGSCGENGTANTGGGAGGGSCTTGTAGGTGGKGIVIIRYKFQ